MDIKIVGQNGTNHVQVEVWDSGFHGPNLIATFEVHESFCHYTVETILNIKDSQTKHVFEYKDCG